MPRRLWILVGFGVTLAAVAVALAVAVPRLDRGSRTRAATAVAPSAPRPPGRKIKARLFYVSGDGARLTGLEREVAFGEGTTEQARQIVEAQIAPVADPLVSAVPPGTMVRAVFVTARGEAFVDFSHELVAGHSGGSTNELLTVYTIVNALTANLPAVTSVQLLVDGKQIETLAGHIDVRRPLEKNLTWVE